jgi:hypothetical protein
VRPDYQVFTVDDGQAATSFLAANDKRPMNVIYDEARRRSVELYCRMGVFRNPSFLKCQNIDVIVAYYVLN